LYKTGDASHVSPTKQQASRTKSGVAGPRLSEGDMYAMGHH
jgi:hypothetical protein